MAVQGQDKGSRLCDRCFASVSEDAEFCDECGAPVSEEPHTEGSDGTIYPMLARANLLRMRGDFKQAEEVCLTILRRYPNNATANGLLGDISAERGDLSQAAEWYELSLDITPDNTAVRDKLSKVKERIREHEAAATAKHLGLPTSRPKVGVYIGLLFLFLVALCVLAFFLGREFGQTGAAAGPRVVDAPVTLEPKAAQPPTDATANVPAPLGANPRQPEEDRNLQAAIAAKAVDGSKLLDARFDPRTGFGSLTFDCPEGEDPRAIGSRLAQAGFDAMPDAKTITLRAVRAGKLHYLADTYREDVQRVAGAEWQQAHQGDPAALANEILKNEWFAAGPETRETGAENRSGTDLSTGGAPSTTGD